MKEKVAQGDYGKVKYYIDVIQKSSWNALNLLTNLIEWSRSQNGKLAFKPEHFDLESLVEEVFKFSLAASEQKSISLEMRIHNITLFADKAMINTILRNLVSNAIKFTDSGGKVSVSAIQEKEFVRISVTDNGIGIEPEVLKNLFNKNENYHTTGTRQETGFGLGLELCQEFVQKHHGENLG